MNAVAASLIIGMSLGIGHGWSPLAGIGAGLVAGFCLAFLDSE